MEKDFLKIAEELYKLGIASKGSKREFAFRSAISRAYYGVLWYIRDFYNLIKIYLDKLGKARNQADYKKDTIFKIDEKSTRYYIYLAKLIVKELNK